MHYAALILSIAPPIIGACAQPATVASAPSPASSCTVGDYCADAALIDPQIVASYAAMSAAASSRPASVGAFEAALHPDFIRTGSGSIHARNRAPYLQSMADWYAAGNYVASESEELMDIRRSGTTTLIRRQISETFADKDGETIGDFEGMVTDVWVLEDGRWWLFYRQVAVAED